jgi:hypothetical protein
MENKIHYNKSYCKNDVDLLSKVIRIYSVIKLGNGLEQSLEKNEERVLVYYLKYGYSKETKRLIIEDLGIKPTYLNTVNCKLDKKGYLIKDKRNKQKKHLSEGLEKLKKSFIDMQSNIYFIQFEK